MKPLVIFGAGDIGKLAHFYFTRDSEYSVAGFTVHRDFRETDTAFGLPLVDFETVSQRFPPTEFEMFVAMSYARMNQLRASVVEQARGLGYRMASYVSSHCTFLSDHPAGDNCLILENNTVQPFVRIGNNVTLWSGNHIGHDSVIEENCFVTSQVVVSGNVHIKRNCFIGVNATLRNSITIGEECCIGAGAIIMKSTEDRSVYIPERSKRFSKTSDQIKL
jgi:sugar O-acyltransferase (sialic acid O-acetyltransferase NeuD family)